MTYLCICLKDYPDIALTELKALFNDIKYTGKGYALIEQKIDLKIADRLSFTKKIGQILIAADNEDELIKKIAENNDVPNLYKDNFAFRKHIDDNILKSTEVELAECIGLRINEISKTKINVNLTNPRTLFELFYFDKKFYLTYNIWTNKEDYKERYPHKRKIFLPISLKPKLARALVNIGSTNKKYRVIDPFCGTGGILIEACLMYIKAQGNDIDERMIEASNQNIKQACNTKINIEQGDAIEYIKKIKEKNYCVVTDPPYSKNTKKVFDAKKFYNELLKVLDNSKAKRIVIMLPEFSDKRYDCTKLIKTIENYNVELITRMYVHKSLNRLIYLLEKK